MEVFVTPNAQDKLGGLSVTPADLRRVILQGAKTQEHPDGATNATLRDLAVRYRTEGDDVLVLNVERRNAPGIRGTSSPF